MIKPKNPVLLIFFFILLCLTSCLSKPPGKVNACLSSPYEFYGIKSVSQPDTSIIAQCLRIEKYDQRTKGNWITYWYLTDWKIIKVESGNWSDPNLSFVIADTWPTPESGIEVDKMPWPYRQGRIFCFGIDTSKKLPLIVSQEYRSRIAPYGPAHALKERKEEIHKKIIESVGNFLKNEGSYFKLTVLQVVEECDDFFVVECLDPNGFAKAVCVDKNTYKANLIPEPFDGK